MNQTKVAHPLDGQRFSRLVVLERLLDSVTPQGGKRVIYKCLCDCGNITETESSSLKGGGSRSCGCLRDDETRKSNTKHGCSPRNGSRALYNCWKSMRSRCYNHEDQSYKGYGERGIKICSTWFNDVKEFCDWSKANGWREGLQIDRKDNDKGYYPENCRFVTPLKNANNQRLLRTTNKSGYRGVSWRRTHGKWHSYINYNWKRVNVGYFNSSIEAAKARDKYAIDNDLDVPLNFER